MYRVFIFILIFTLGLLSRCFGQNIRMEFPHFAGKTYEFIIFQGSSAKKVLEGKIPEDGRFVLSVPKEYVPYTGMCRWLITGTEEGGGLDMVIPGKDFSVRCLSEKPDNSNIVYTGSTETVRLNALHVTQEQIFARHDAMFQATKAFSQTDRNYPIFMKEYQKQLETYEHFQTTLKGESSYAAKFLKIVNITLGIGPKIENSEEKRAQDISKYITEELNWGDLYTSGHWTAVISSWVDINTQVFKDKNLFASDFAMISKKLNDKKQYIDFANRVAHILSEQGKDDFISIIAPMVIASGKIEKYEGALAVYNKGIVGSFAPDLVLDREINGKKEKLIFKSNELSGENDQKTLLVFYNSECGPCDSLLQELSQSFPRINSKGIRIICISSDTNETQFRNKAKTFPWKDAYCDLEGIKGENFRNFGVIGTPSLVLIDTDGKILARGTYLREIEVSL
ncbi:thioredoxin family protein [Chryseobacterium sp. NRRL B-14798]|uniref:peroxiredoxin family protein n=1 Tax=Chryseobacterium sp. NRRL B-14798 TaxID=3162880 RepID=UPI003D210F1E